MFDWTGNRKTHAITIGASNHSSEIRHFEDYYATDPKAVYELLRLETFAPDIWEPACGEGHISKVLEAAGYNVRSSDLIDRGYGNTKDFLFFNDEVWNGDIITNPPYKFAKEFVQKAIDIIPKGRKVAMFLKLTFLEGKERKELFKITPPHTVYVSSSRLSCAKNGDFSKGENAIAYCWYVWVKGYKGETKIKWFN